MDAPGAERHLAVIDIGSNTAKLVALAYRPGYGYRHLDQLRDVVRLSQGMGEDGRLREDAMQRALDTLDSFRRYCDASRIEEIVATATSAVRDAVNGPEFLARVRRETGIHLDVLSGEAEARAGVRAVANSFSLDDALVVDLGGGSVQLSVMRDRRTVHGHSWPLGAVRATERFLAGDPARKKHVKALRTAVRDAVEPWLEARNREAEREGVTPPSDLPWVGMGGTLRSLAEAWQQRVDYPLPLLHGYRFRAEDLHVLATELAGMPLADRSAMPGLGSDRADIIVAGAVVLDELLQIAGRDAYLVSGQGLREGMFYPKLFVHEPGHLAPDVRTFTARNLMRRYHGDTTHAERVADFALVLYDALAGHFGYGEVERDWLQAAAWLHDVGMAIDYYGHHRHGAYLVMARPLPGFTHREQAIIADLVRSHRKGKAQATVAPTLLEPGDAERLKVLAGILHVAEQLERSKAGRVERIDAHLHDDRFDVRIHARGDATLERNAAVGRTDLLAGMLDRPVDVHVAQEMLA